MVTAPQLLGARLALCAKCASRARRTALQAEGASTDHTTMPTHRDKSDGFEEAAARRSRELDAAIERSREARRDRALAELRAKNEARRSSSVPPPGRR
jgi:hypothetical protein